MKYFRITMLVFLLIPVAATAQRMHFGVKGGLNIYNIHESKAYFDYKTLTGFHGGIFGNIRFSKKFSFQSEVVYSTQGARYLESLVGGPILPSIPVDLRLRYINIPFLLQYECKKNLQFEAGLQLGIFTKAQILYKDNNTNYTYTDEYKRGEFSFIMGLNYSFPHTGLGIDARYNLGLSTIHESTDNQKESNRGAQIGIFYLFKHK